MNKSSYAISGGPELIHQSVELWIIQKTHDLLQRQRVTVELSCAVHCVASGSVLGDSSGLARFNDLGFGDSMANKM